MSALTAGTRVVREGVRGPAGSVEAGTVRRAVSRPLGARPGDGPWYVVEWDFNGKSIHRASHLSVVKP